jgi:phosphoglucomutase
MVESAIFDYINKNHMDPNIQQKIDSWLSGNYEQSVKDSILQLQKDKPDELADAFYKNLEFGTGG